MTSDQVISAIRAIRKNHPENLMARYFDEDYFLALEEPLRQRLTKIIASGIENPDSQMGAYVMNRDDYDQFAALLDPIIRDFHGLGVDSDIDHRQDWDTSALSCDLGAVDERLKDISMRVRVARNVSTFPLPGAMSKEQRLAFEDIAARAFASLSKEVAFAGRYFSITPGSPYEISTEEYDRRVDAHQMFKDMSSDRYLNAAGISADWPFGRGIYVSKLEDFLVWVGEEDHLRIMAMQRGGNLNELFERLRGGLEHLERLLPPFAISPVYGNATSCPSNLGAGMRASLHLQLPNLTSNGQDLTRLKREAKSFGLAVRGAGGEHSDAGGGGLVDISPSARLGITEAQIMRRLYDGACALWKMETG